MPSLEWVSNPVMIPLLFLYIMIFGGPFSEEFGWRGYALPLLQKNYSGIYSAIILGVIWGLWSIPLFFIHGTIQSQVPFWAFMILTICASIIFAWVYNSTGSLLAVMFIHVTENISYYIFPIQDSPISGAFLIILNVFVALLVFFFGGWNLKSSI